MRKLKRGAAQGSQIITMMGLFLFGLMVSALAIDFAYYFTARNALQTAADSAALAAATELYRDISIDPTTRKQDAILEAKIYLAKNQSNLTLNTSDVLFGFIDPVTKIYNAASFTTPSSDPNFATTGGYNAVRILVRKTQDSPNGQLNTVMANLLGLHKMDASVGAVAMLDQTVNTLNNAGLRPIYACQAQFNTTMQDGIPENDLVRIYGDHMEVNGVQNTTGCPAMGSGNWGFADFTNCGSGTVGASTIADWFANGYPGSVAVGQCYSTKPGNFIASMTNELDTLVSNKTIFPIPIYNSWGGNGSNTHVNISGFVGFKITDYQAHGAQANRYIEGHFYRYACDGGCSSRNATTTTPAGSVVKLRLASSA